MKRVISIILILILLFSCSCNKQEFYNYEVTAEPFESMEIINFYTDHETYSSEQQLYDDSDLVFVGMPIETFTDGEEVYYTFNGEKVEKDSKDKIIDYYTLRDVQIVELIKGDVNTDVIKVADRAVVKENENNEQIIVGLPTSSSIAKKNVKYIYYAYKARGDEYYFVNLDQGLVNVDNLDKKTNEKISEERQNQIKEKFFSKFEKYDRSHEVSE